MLVRLLAAFSWRHRISAVYDFQATDSHGFPRRIRIPECLGRQFRSISGSYKVRPAELHRLTLNAPPLETPIVMGYVKKKRRGWVKAGDGVNWIMNIYTRVKGDKLAETVQQETRQDHRCFVTEWEKTSVWTHASGICTWSTSHDTFPCTPTPVPVPAYRSSTKYEEGQLWLISFFRQLLTTKVTTAQWFCGSITPTEELPRSWSAEETLNLNTHCILPQRWECSEGHC